MIIVQQNAKLFDLKRRGYDLIRMSHHRDNVPSATETTIFVTHVEGDRDCLRIWAQQNQQTASYVEQYINSLIDKFIQGYGCPTEPNQQLIGALCCGKFKNDGYYRAKILSTHNGITVHFIDYGNIEVLSPNDVHVLADIPGAEAKALQSYPPVATDFVLLKVLPINGVWENRVIETIKNILCYNEFRVLVSNAKNRCLIKLWYNNEDFSDLLIRRHLALPTNIQDICRYILYLVYHFVLTIYVFEVLFYII